MKECFTNYEKKIIKYFINNFNSIIETNALFAENMDAVAIELLVNKEFAIVTQEEIEPSLNYSKAERSILEIICLINYLIDSKLIYPFQFYDKEIKSFIEENDIIRIYDKKKYKFVSKTTEPKLFTIEGFATFLGEGGYANIEEPKNLIFFYVTILKSQVYVYEFFNKYSGCFLFPTPLLKELYENDFKTNEIIRFEKQLKKAEEQLIEAKQQTKFSKCALIVSWGAFLFAILFGFISKCTSTKIDQDQIDSIKSSIELSTQIKSIDANVTN
jgi:hypothetical protein